MENKNLIVGIETSDDAAVYKLTEDIAVIQTLDFFTPVVDDPYTYGAIAAANSLSDVYAMGGKPTVALNIVCFPNCLNIEVLGEILKGGADKVIEAGAVVIGGHTVEDDEPKYGLSVMGMVHPSKVLKNYGSRVGDVLILTKPIGTGIITTAIKAEMASKEVYNEAVKVMSTLNKYAGEIIVDYNITACTDITGFGIMGHGYEMASASEVTFKLYKDKLPLINGVKEYAQMGLIPAGCYNNKKYLKDKYQLKNVETWLEDVLFDPQTSGGLLVSISASEGKELMEKLSKLEIPCEIIGEVIPKEEKHIIVE
ncbi:selenide,water dikinase [Clostridium punense]|uniref:Selenide, water dikinase n=2 Tax=Clostridiaceae TaxID=31979 RepID=A0ABS4JXK9_9CLOT|nr:segregation protein A [Clostridium sp. BL8]MBP2020246.1 selenide,water dikinase [Clostridium punense]